MKKTLALLLLLATAISLTFAQTEKETETPLNPRTGFPEIENLPFAMFNEGVIATQINRVELKENRSNFVRQDYLMGVYVALQTKNIQPADSYLQISAFYPLFHTFNGMQQRTKQMFLFAADVFYGPLFQTDIWKYVRIHFVPGLHYTFQLTDEFYLHYLGVEMMAGIDLPLAHHWSLLLNGAFTVDYPNLGTNRLIQPYDYAWQYQISFGVRYSKRGRNDFAYIESRRYAREKNQSAPKE